MKAKEEMARQASEYYSNKDLWREELSRYKQILNEVVANMNSIIENANTRPSARRKAEKEVCSLNKTENEEHQRLYHAPPLKTETAFPYSS